MNEFIKKWCARHSNPINAVLHALGIPAAVAGVVLFFYAHFILGLLLLFLGYVLQVVGHVFEGTEVGELMLIRHIITKIFPAKK